MKKFVILGIFSFLAFLPMTANAQSVPTFEDGAWVMPTHDTAPAAQGGGSYEDMIYEVCATQGCYTSPEYMIATMYCESGGDPNASAYNPLSGNTTNGLFQIDAMWHVSNDPYAQIVFAAEHLGNDIWWACP